MKKTYILLGILMITIGLYFFLVHDQGQTSMNPNDIAFAIEDTGAVNRIVLTQYREGETINRMQLDRLPSGRWQLNGEYLVYSHRINYLLQTMHLIHVKEKLIDDGINSALAILDTYHTQMEAFGENGLIKSYKIGTDAQGSRGTLMKLNDSKFPFIVELPGMQGFVNSRFAIDPKVWRENLLFVANPDKIKSVSITYPDPDRSFQLIRESAEDDWRLFASENKLDDAQLQAYLSNFQGQINAESFATNDFPGKLEELKGQAPDVIFSVSYFDMEPRTIYLFEREDNRNNFFGWVEGDEELLTIQHFVFDKFLVDRGSLLGGI